MIEKIYRKTNSISIKQGDILVLKYPDQNGIPQYDMDQIVKIFKTVQKAVPQWVNVIAVPVSFQFDVISVDDKSEVSGVWHG